PGETVWAISGDGGFQMNMAEIATMVQERLPVKMAIFNNGYLGMVRQWQQFFHGKRYSCTPIWSPDYVKLAEAYGIPGKNCCHCRTIPRYPLLKIAIFTGSRSCTIVAI